MLHNRLEHTREISHLLEAEFVEKMNYYRLGECYNQKHRIPALKGLSGVFLRKLGGTVEFMLHPLL